MKVLATLLILPWAVGAGALLLLAHGNGDLINGRNQMSQMGDHTSGNRTVRGPGDKLSRNPALTAKLQALLPAGTDLQTAAAGFKNLSQFVAAVHLVHNLKIPFDQLKTKMMTPTSLERAIQDLKPNLSHATVNLAVRIAGQQANQDLGYCDDLQFRDPGGSAYCP